MDSAQTLNWLLGILSGVLAFLWRAQVAEVKDLKSQLSALKDIISDLKGDFADNLSKLALTISDHRLDISKFYATKPEVAKLETLIYSMNKGTFDRRVQEFKNGAD
jgi:type II secretory pathway pseudopilin PulG